ncbi:MAG: hypothetical protein SO206_07030 [Bacilli bacterium]|nr:hypothetical protein [Bacilli bacterium]
MKLNITCPCCNKSVQVILSSHMDTGDVKVTGVFLNEENDDSNIISDNDLLSKYNICLGESEVNYG